MILSPELQQVLYGTPLLLIYSFIFGAIWGSYLNVCIYRIPACISTAHPRSRCPKCESPIKGYDNIPIFSWLILGGKCRSCKTPISPRYMLVEALTGILFALTFHLYGISWLTPIYWLMIFGLLLGTFVDFDEQWLPDRVTKGGIIIGLLISTIFPALHGFTYWRFGLMASFGGAAIGFGLLWLVVEFGKLFLGRMKFNFEEPIHWVLEEQKYAEEPKMPPLPFYINWVRWLGTRLVPAKKEVIEKWVYENFIKLPEPIEPAYLFYDDPKGADEATERDEDGQVKPSVYYWSEIYARKTDAVHLNCTELSIDGETIDAPGEIRVFQNRLVAGEKVYELEAVKRIEGTADRVVIPREAMGFGDVKLLGAIGAFVGWQGAIFSLVASAFIGTICGILIGLITRQGIRGVRIPYGPYIAAGALLWIFWGESIWGMVLGYSNPFTKSVFMSRPSRTNPPQRVNIVLVGFMGTGKTTVSELLAAQLDWPCIDLDARIEAEAGRSIPDIFEQDGEAGFRVLEHQAVTAAAAGSHQVISCGGGIVKNPDNLELLQTTGTLFCLTARPETILERVGAETHRPLLVGDDRLERIQDLLEERLPLYAQIEQQVSTDGKSPETVAAEILGRLPAQDAD